MSQTALAKLLSITRSSVSQWEAGLTEPSAQKLRAVAMQTGARYEWLATNRGDRRDEDAPSRRTVYVKGYVAAGAQVHYLPIEVDLDVVESPGPPNDKTVALEIRGSSLGDLFDRWLVFFDDVHREIATELVGRLCVVGLPDGRVMVKKVKPNGSGLYDLISNTEEPIRNVEIEWAARVKVLAQR